MRISYKAPPPTPMNVNWNYPPLPVENKSIDAFMSG